MVYILSVTLLLAGGGVANLLQRQNTVTISISDPDPVESPIIISGPGPESFSLPSILPSSVSTAGPPLPNPSGTSGPQCGKGYTYCGYMLQQDGHNFDPSVINTTYCEGLEDNCPDGIPNTLPEEAVYLCMDDDPASIQLFCACSGQCLNEEETNYIAHCDVPCTNLNCD
ncbi:hypothetical protein BX600DRAFT_437232 [Xylariales sp. PMI_506]|nr:hypothetical protein BX600DRAFT_437232 [Xylariales sp. PMI_506]